MRPWKLPERRQTVSPLPKPLLANAYSRFSFAALTMAAVLSLVIPASITFTFEYYTFKLTAGHAGLTKIGRPVQGALQL